MNITTDEGAFSVSRNAEVRACKPNTEYGGYCPAATYFAHQISSGDRVLVRGGVGNSPRVWGVVR